MNVFATVMISGICLMGATIFPTCHDQAVAATTLTGSLVEAIDSTGLSITVKTAGDGETLSMPVASPEIMKGVTVGDQVSLELDLQGRVVKIVKLSPASKKAPETQG
ncbi:MAG: hypothetical protein GDA67_00345 [Nitrospira sp. CR1.3]|nr:hypothetical protein [Nitrospira sp. CR1.3]